MLVIATSCQPHVLARSESPDEKYAVEVYHGSPSWLWGRKHRYYFNVIDRSTYRDLDGPSFEYKSDLELQETDFHFIWQDQRVEVTITHAGNQVGKFAGQIEGRKHIWTQTA